MAAVALAISSGGALSSFETTVLLTRGLEAPIHSACQRPPIPNLIDRL
jgi:hypothetical protein